MGRKAIDLTGQRFGRLVVLERIPTPKFYANRDAWWNCKCDCGKLHAASSRNLRMRCRSCGCYRAERMREIGKYERRKKNDYRWYQY